MAYGMRLKSSKSQPNYRVLAGIETEDQKPRRTSAEVAADREKLEAKRKEVEANRQAVAERIAELEARLARDEIELNAMSSVSPPSGYVRQSQAPLSRSVDPEMISDDDSSGDDGSPLAQNERRVSNKAVKLTRADVDAARKLKQGSSSAVKPAAHVPRGKENRPPLATTSASDARKRKTGEQPTPASVKKPKPAGPVGIRGSWAVPEPKVTASASGRAIAAARTGPGAGNVDQHREDTVQVAGNRRTEQGIVQVDRQQSGGQQLPDTSTASHGVRRVNAGKKFTNADLPLPNALMWKWRQVLIPRYLTILGDSGQNPWNLTGINLVGTLQDLWDEIFPEFPVKVSPREAIYDVAQQRVYEWRYGIAKAGLEAVAAYLRDEEHFRSENERAEHVVYALGPGLPFRYAYSKEVESDEKKLVGPYQSAYILRTLGYHFGATGHPVNDKHDFPYAALALSVISVERALTQWKSGRFIKSEDKFCQEIYGKTTSRYMRSIADLKESTWIKIMSGADVFAQAHTSSQHEALDAVSDLDDRADIVDDSDSDVECID